MRRSFAGPLGGQAKRKQRGAAHPHFEAQSEVVVSPEGLGEEASREGAHATELLEQTFVRWRQLAEALDGRSLRGSAVAAESRRCAGGLFEILDFSDQEGDSSIEDVARRLADVKLDAPAPRTPPSYEAPSAPPPFVAEHVPSLPKPTSFQCKKCGHAFSQRRTRDVHASRCK